MEIPKHLGIILDGNRRWAKEKGLSSFEGHRKGLERVQNIINFCKNKGIKILTFFVFSTENWKRGEKEVGYLMRLARKAVNNHFQHLHKDKIKIRVIGQKEKLPLDLQKDITEIEKLTEHNKEMTVNFALSYGGRAEIVSAIKNIVEKKIPPEKIDENVVKENLWASDVDLIVRTGKEKRLSNFLIWQAAYSELYFSKKYWPDFTEADLGKILEEYTLRQRRFGG